jgi:transcription elongation GreA/GreB family factor
MPTIKQQLVTEIINHLQAELSQAMQAANNAHSAAVDDQSVAETQYDTLAIEASYLAEGQSKRVLEYQNALQAYQLLSLVAFNENSTVALTTLVQLSKDKAAQHWFFIGPYAGGFRANIAGHQITVISPQSPMGMAMLGKQQDDDIEIKLGNEKLQDYIQAIK